MALILFANNATSTLAGPITNTATTINLASGTGALFPSPSGGNYFTLTLNDAATGLLYEVCYCTSVAVDALTVTRGQETSLGGGSARSWLAGDVAFSGPTAGTLTAMVQQAAVAPTRILTASGAFVTTANDANGYVGLNRTAGVGVSSTTLPAGAVQSQSYAYQDLAKNFAAFPLTVTYPGGQTGPGGAASNVCNVNGGTYRFLYYGSNQWGFEV